MSASARPPRAVRRVAENPAAPRPARKPPHAYHHGRLRQALVDQAVAMIRNEGVEALTLRAVGAPLRVSRTALYRHFSDKQSLLVAVATEGFRAFRQALATAWDSQGHGRAGFLAMGHAYVRFALENPSHYRVMFGGYVSKDVCHAELMRESEASFRTLLDALAELQQVRLVQPGDVSELAMFVWASTHGAAMLGIGGHLARSGVPIDDVIRRMMTHVWDAVAAPRRPGLSA